jgi:predicted transglutaminase-like cysteine proteinase
MSIFLAARKSIVIFVFFIIILCQNAQAAVYASEGEQHISRDASATSLPEPFNLSTSLIPDGPLRTKWQDVARTIEAEAKTIAECRTHPDTCESPAAARFLDVVRAASARSGVARLGEVNRAINLAIRPVSDLTQYGIEDHWSSPLATLASGAGDCEDYAIAKLAALREAGVANDDLRLVILRETTTGEDHALLAARVDGRWRLLDNRTFVMIEDADLSKQQPLFAIDTEGVKRFEQTPVATAQVPQDVSPASPATTGTSGAETSGIEGFSSTLIL